MIIAYIPLGSYNCPVCLKPIKIDSPCYYEYPDYPRQPVEQLVHRDCHDVFAINPLVYEDVELIYMAVVDPNDPVNAYLMDQTKAAEGWTPRKEHDADRRDSS
jgi:hypothetical protein